MDCGGMANMMGGMFGTGFGGWGMGWLVGALWMVLFWGGIIALVVWVVRRLTDGRGAVGVAQANPLDVAKMRLARGEITSEQFGQLKKDLGG